MSARSETFAKILQSLSRRAASGSSIIEPGTTRLVSSITLPEGAGVRTFVRRMGGNVTKTGNVDTIEYLHAVARAADVPENQIQNIVDEGSAWEVISKNLGIWGGGQAPEDAVEASARYAKQLNKSRIAAQNEEPFKELVKAVQGDKYDVDLVARVRAERARQRKQGLTPDFQDKRIGKQVSNSIERAESIVDNAYRRAAINKESGLEAVPYGTIPEENLAAAGFSGVRFAADSADIVDLIRAGDISKARMAFDDMTFNSMLSVPPAMRNKYLAKHDSPMFYLLSDIRNRWVSSKTGVPLNVIQSLGGVGSANRGPAPESLRVIRGITGIDYDPAKGFFRSNEASVARSGKETLEPANMDTMASALNDLVDNKVGGMTIPARTSPVTGLRAKAGDYATQSGNALGTRSSVQDLWEHRAPFARTDLATPDSNSIAQNLVLQAVSASSARQLGVSSLPAAQEMRWKNMHDLVKGRIDSSFYPTESVNVQFPQMKSGEITKKTGLPAVNVDDILASSSAEAGNPAALRLQQGLVESIESNPDMWVSVAGTPLPVPRRTFVPGAADPKNANAAGFADWLSKYATESRDLSRAERLNSILSVLPKKKRPKYFKSATPYIGASVPPIVALTLMSQDTGEDTYQ